MAQSFRLLGTVSIIMGRGLIGIGVLFVVLGILMAVKAAGDKDILNGVLGIGVAVWGAVMIRNEVKDEDKDKEI